MNFICLNNIRPALTVCFQPTNQSIRDSHSIFVDQPLACYIDIGYLGTMSSAIRALQARRHLKTSRRYLRR